MSLKGSKMPALGTAPYALNYGISSAVSNLALKDEANDGKHAKARFSVLALVRHLLQGVASKRCNRLILVHMGHRPGGRARTMVPAMTAHVVWRENSCGVVAGECSRAHVPWAVPRAIECQPFGLIEHCILVL